MYKHNKAQQSKNRVHISWDILYGVFSWLITYTNIKRSKANIVEHIMFSVHISSICILCLEIYDKPTVPDTVEFDIVTPKEISQGHTRQ